MATAITLVVGVAAGMLLLAGAQALRRWDGEQRRRRDRGGEGPYRTAPEQAVVCGLCGSPVGRVLPHGERTSPRPPGEGPLPPTHPKELGRTSPSAAGPGPLPPRAPQQPAPPSGSRTSLGNPNNDGPQPTSSPQPPPRARARARVPVDEGVPLAIAATATGDARREGGSIVIPVTVDPDHARAFVAATRPSLVEPCPCGSARRCWRHTAIAICRTVREDELYRVVGGGDA